MNTLNKNDSIVKFQLTKLHAKIPRKGSTGSAGFDLFSPKHMVIKPHKYKVVPIGLKIALPRGTYGRIAPRSGLAAKFGMDIGAGEIDADYRGEISVLVFNHGDNNLTIETNVAIAQLIVEEIRDVEFILWKKLSSTPRAERGFGSTDVRALKTEP